MSKAGDFADFAESVGWTVERIVDGETKTVKASRPEQEVTATWVGASAMGPIGKHTYPGGIDNIRNASEARKILVSETLPEVKVRKPRVVKPRTERVRKPLEFDPYETPDAEVIKMLEGRTISWSNQFTNVDETAHVPRDSKTIKIETSKSPDTLGERILTFCDRRASGYRSVFLAAITRVR